MPRFFFTALSPDGSTISGDIVADQDTSALEQVSRRGLIPLSITRSGPGSGQSWWQRDIRLIGGSDCLPVAAQEHFVSTLAALLEARLPLLRALAFCVENAVAAGVRSTLAGVRDSVENGMTLAAAMAASRPGFPSELVAIIQAGEASNQLPAILRRAAQAMATRARLRREIRGSLIYPGLLLGLSVAILLMIAFYLAPTLLPVFASSGASPPFALAVLAGLGQSLKDGWPVLLAGIAALCVAAWLGRVWLGAAGQHLAMSLPMLGAHLKRRETLNLASTIALMLESGETLLRAVVTAREATASPRFVAVLDEAEHAITAGGALAPILAKSGLIDPMSMTLIAAGEEADRLAAALGAVCSLLETKVSQGISRAISLLTPMLTLVLGLGVGSIILATISAIMDMNDLAM